jgi:hypothetical protein
VPRKPDKDEFLARFVKRRCPLPPRGSAPGGRYNSGVSRHGDGKQGKVLIVAPENTEGMDTLTKERAAMERLYNRGLADGGAIPAFLAR